MILGEIKNIQVIARGNSIRELSRLRKFYGKGRWRKLKGVVMVQRISTKRIRLAEIHWYEAHGIGKRDGKIKRWLD